MAERAATRRRVPLWVQVALPLLVLAVALVIGAGVFSSGPETAAQRVAAIEAGVRCPSCTDVSVADSDATTAIAVRHQIQSMVDAGQSTAAIDQVLVSEYGQTILLVPPDTGGIPSSTWCPSSSAPARWPPWGSSSGGAPVSSMRSGRGRRRERHRSGVGGARQRIETQRDRRRALVPRRRAGLPAPLAGRRRPRARGGRPLRRGPRAPHGARRGPAGRGGGRARGAGPGGAPGTAGGGHGRQIAPSAGRCPCGAGSASWLLACSSSPGSRSWWCTRCRAASPASSPRAA